ncbi:MAG: hypothetical protein AAF720_00880 [Pseudomonadota bacterium]
MQKGIKEFQKLLKEQLDFAAQESNKRVASRLIQKSPVAEGEYVSEWEVGLNGFPGDQQRGPDKSKTNTRRRLQQPTQAIKFGQDTFYANHDEVARRIEFGYSGKAPQGVIRVTARAWKRIAKGVARAVTAKAKKRYYETKV